MLVRGRMLYSQKIRIYPTTLQQNLIEKTFGCCRWVYNEALSYCQDSYSRNSAHPSRFQLINRLPKLKPDNPWLYEVDSQALQFACRCVDMAFKHFFKSLKEGGKPGFPRFKSKFSSHASYTTTAVGCIKYANNKIRLPKVGWLKSRGGKTCPPVIKSATVSRTPTEKYYVSILFESDRRERNENKENVQLDIKIQTHVGKDNFVLFVDGKGIHAPSTIGKLNAGIIALKSQLARKKRRSYRRQKLKSVLARKYEKQHFIRQNFIHTLTSKLSGKKENIILLELQGELNASAHRTSGEHSRASSLHSPQRKKITSVPQPGYGEFVRQLKYKSLWKGKELIIIDNR